MSTMQSTRIVGTCSKVPKSKATLELINNANEQVTKEDMHGIMEDALTCFLNREEEECETTQQFIGMSNLFRGFAVKDWKHTNVNSVKCNDANKTLLKRAKLFYAKCQKYRNEEYYDSEKQRKRFIEQYKKLKKHVEEKELPKVQ